MKRTRIVQITSVLFFAGLIDTFTALSGKPSYFPDTVHPNANGCRLIAKTVAASLTSERVAKLKPRIVVLTDISTYETDDWESMTRLLAHADLFEIEGLCLSNGASLPKTVNKNFIKLIQGRSRESKSNRCS